MNDLDTLLADALRADAERAPTMPDEWDLGARPFRAEAHRPPGIALVIAAALVFVIGATAWFIRREGDDRVGGPATTWQPVGTESPLTDLGPADAVLEGPVPIALTRRIGVAGQPDLVVTPMLTYLGGTSAEDSWCTGGAMGWGCRPVGRMPPWSVSITSSVDNRVASFDLFVIDGLPTNVAFVTYERNGQRFWQRPVVGVAAFPAGRGSEGVAVGYDSAGQVVGRYDSDTASALSADAPPPVRASLSDRQFQELGQRTRNLMFDCFHSFGGLVDDHDIATFPSGVDQQQVWDECVASTKAAVTALVSTFPTLPRG